MDAQNEQIESSVKQQIDETKHALELHQQRKDIWELLQQRMDQDL
jgi:hypothetical protein